MTKEPHRYRFIRSSFSLIYVLTTDLVVLTEIVFEIFKYLSIKNVFYIDRFKYISLPRVFYKPKHEPSVLTATIFWNVIFDISVIKAMYSLVALYDIHWRIYRVVTFYYIVYF